MYCIKSTSYKKNKLFQSLLYSAIVFSFKTWKEEKSFFYMYHKFSVFHFYKIPKNCLIIFAYSKNKLNFILLKKTESYYFQWKKFWICKCSVKENANFVSIRIFFRHWMIDSFYSFCSNIQWREIYTEIKDGIFFLP